jgi:transcriptional regulator with XRE-family HTH domain
MRTNNLNRSVRAMRHALGDSQQRFAQRLDLGIATVVRYERNRAPRGKALARLRRLAEENNLPRYAQLFGDALATELGPVPEQKTDERGIERLTKTIAGGMHAMVECLDRIATALESRR